MPTNYKVRDNDKAHFVVPVADGIVEKAEDYFYSSARNYAELSTVIDVVLIPPQLITY